MNSYYSDGNTNCRSRMMYAVSVSVPKLWFMLTNIYTIAQVQMFIGIKCLQYIYALLCLSNIDTSF